MTELSWELVRDKPNQKAEFASCHDNFAWRKHHASRFIQLSNAFHSKKDSILILFSGGNRTSREHPEYGEPRFAVVWYEDEDWAILCDPREAVLIPAEDIRKFKRQKDGASERIQYIRRLFDLASENLRRQLGNVRF